MLAASRTKLLSKFQIPFRPASNETNQKGKAKKPSSRMAFLFDLAEWTGLEPATPGVTGRYSNQLNYHSNLLLCRRLKGSALTGREI